MKRKEQKAAYLFLLPSLAGTAIFVLIPFADVIRRSFLKAVGNTFVGFENYREVLMNQAFREAVLHTVKFLAVCLPLLLLFSFGTALMLCRLPAAKAFFQYSLKSYKNLLYIQNEPNGFHLPILL